MTVHVENMFKSSNVFRILTFLAIYYEPSLHVI